MKIKKTHSKKTMTIRVIPETWAGFKKKCKDNGYRIPDVLDYLLKSFIRKN